jgi:Amiloride-sensitive sodium channel
MQKMSSQQFIYICPFVAQTGLNLLLNIQQNQYVSQGGSTAGVVVLPLTQNIMPFPEDHGLLVGPGYATSISLSTVSQSHKIKFQIEQNETTINTLFPNF